MLAGTGVVALILAVAVYHEDDGMLPTFASTDELQEFVEARRSDSLGDHYASADLSRGTADEVSQDSTSADYSMTNIQVEGVDEADFVKTDGDLIFISSRGEVSIIEAGDDGDLEMLSVVGQEELSPHLPDDSYYVVDGLYTYGDRLLIVLSTYGNTFYDVELGWEVAAVSSAPMTYVAVADVSDPSQPEVLFLTGVSGWAQASRLVDGVVYLVTVHSIWWYEEDVPMPAVWDSGESEEVAPSDILYDPDAGFVESYINVLSLDSRTGQFETISILSAWASTVYMTADHLYITYQKWSGEVILMEDGASPEDTNSAQTTVYKLAIDGLSLDQVAKGEVKGWLLNQFSMDESSGFLRLATTTSWSTPENAVYVLDEDLLLVGELTGLAPAETIFSARFVEDTLYLVTFFQIDPLFVIDLSDPYSPELLGELKVPGFSSYLHPIGDGLLIGVGSENGTAKVSVFDVSDPSTPVEVDTAYLGEGLADEEFVVHSYSAAEWDHKAFLYDPARRMLVLPVTVYGWMTSGEDLFDYYSDYFQWDGFRVFAVSEDGSLDDIGAIEHPDWATRSLYIGDVLYTVSWSTVSSHSIPGLEPIDSIVYYDMYRDYTEPQEELRT